MGFCPTSERRQAVVNYFHGAARAHDALIDFLTLSIIRSIAGLVLPTRRSLYISHSFFILFHLFRIIASCISGITLSYSISIFHVSSIVFSLLLTAKY